MSPIPFRTLALVLIVTALGAIAVHGQVVEPKRTDQALPEYPYHLWKKKVSGEVVIEHIVTTNGSVEHPKVIHASNKKFIRPAFEAIRKWQFKPGTEDGVPVIASIQSTVRFKIENALPPRDSPPRRNRYWAPPAYPEKMKGSGEKGKVRMRLKISRSGEVSSAKIVESDHKGFNRQAVSVAKIWNYWPAIKNGKRVKGVIEETVSFEEDPGQIVMSVAKTTDPSHFAGFIRQTERIHELLTKVGGRYWSPFSNLSKNQQKALPRKMRYSTPPVYNYGVSGIYPFAELLANHREVITGQVTISAKGEAIKIEWASENANSALKGATTAILESARFQPATRKKKPVATKMNFKINFDPYSGDVRITNSAASILKKLRLEGSKAKFTSTKALDQKLTIVTRKSPMPPRLGTPEETEGTALIEFYIDEQGNTALPRVYKTDHPGFGYAAVQAIAQWKFEPPLKDGQPVVVKVRVPVVFKGE